MPLGCGVHPDGDLGEAPQRPVSPEAHKAFPAHPGAAMGVYLDDVVYWVREWATSGEPISEAVARTIATYWVGAPGPLAEFALGLPVERDLLLDDLAEHIRYVRSAHVWEDTATELYALKAWVEAS